MNIEEMLMRLDTLESRYAMFCEDGWITIKDKRTGKLKRILVDNTPGGEDKDSKGAKALDSFSIAQIRQELMDERNEALHGKVTHQQITEYYNSRPEEGREESKAAIREHFAPKLLPRREIMKNLKTIKNDAIEEIYGRQDEDSRAAGVSKDEVDRYIAAYERGEDLDDFKWNGI